VSTTLFTAWGYDVSILEFIAAIVSFVGVWLGTTGKRITWPWWALSSTLYGIFYYQSEFFASSLLQIAFVVAAVFGWFGWAPTGAVPGTLSVRNRQYIAIGTIISVSVLSPLLSNIGAAATWTDAFILVASLAAQVLMIYEKFEAWVIWIIVNVTATIQFFILDYWFTSVLYAVFTVVAVIGLKRWHDTLRN
jgi:nicotinamide mononucleotide transporter